MARHIRWKIVAPYLVLVLTGAFVGTFVVTQLVTSSLNDRFTNQLAESARVMEDAVVRQEQRHLETVRAVTFTEGLIEAVERGDSTEIEAIVLPIAANAGVQRIDVLDPGGVVVLGVERVAGAELDYRIDGAGESRSGLSPVRSVIDSSLDKRGDKFAGLVAFASQSWLMTVGPLTADGVAVGAVAVSTTLPGFLAAAQPEVLAHITLYDNGGVPLASTFSIDDQAMPIAGDEAGARSTLDLFGREYDLLYEPLKLRGEVLGWYSVALPTDFISSAQESTRVRLGGLFAAGALLVLLVGLLLARLITKPLMRLVRSALQLGSGDLTVRADVASRDELGVLARTFNDMASRIERQHLATLGALVSAIDARDPYTRGHSVRVGHLSVAIGKEMGMDRAQLQHLQVGGYLHDIGKIGIRDAVLLKPGGLTAEERQIIQQHPTIGLDILAQLELPGEITAIVGQHHERLDGGGYPLGVGAAELTAYPRIAAVADIYDALSTSRPYRKAMTVEEALEILRKEALSGLLDPDVVATMSRVAEAWELQLRLDPALVDRFGGPLSQLDEVGISTRLQGQRPA